MREILFRAKTTENEWVQGDLIHEPLLENAPCRISYQYQSGLFVVTHTEEVLPETVGEYTGLTDKNGNKIFEGDIINAYDRIYMAEINVKGDVSYHFGSFGIGKKGTGYLPLSQFRTENIEVIGNIHDNPELLKERD